MPSLHSYRITVRLRANPNRVLVTYAQATSSKGRDVTSALSQLLATAARAWHVDEDALAHTVERVAAAKRLPGKRGSRSVASAGSQRA